METTSDPTHQKFRLTVEPVIFLLLFGIMLSSPVITSLYLQQVCLASLNFNSSVCLSLNTGNKTVEALIQTQVSVLQMIGTVVETFLPAITSLFLGPWSDINGRLTLLLWPSLGFAVKYFILLELSLLKNISPFYFLLAYLPLAFSGGSVSVFIACYSYINDITIPDKRTIRMGIAEGAALFGSLLGFLGSSYLYIFAGNYGFIATFGTSSFLSFICFLYILLYLPESVTTSKVSSSYKNFFNIDLLKDMYHTCFKIRTNRGRAVILIFTFILTSCIITLEGESSVALLFVEEKFDWNMKNYTNFATITIILNCIGLLLASWLIKTFHASDVITAIIIFCSKAVACIVSAISPTEWYFYAGAIIGMIGGLSGPVCRSALSKIVPRNEIGKVFSLTSSFEALAPLVASPLYTVIYNESVTVFPGMFLFLSSGFFMLDVLLLCMIPLLRNSSLYQPASLTDTTTYNYTS